MDKYRQSLQEDDEDNTLAQLMDEYAEAEGEALWQAFQAAEAAGTAPEVPENLDVQCGQRIGKKADRHRIRFGNGLRRVAVIALVLLCLMPPLVMSVDALKFPILNFAVDVGDKFSAFVFGKKVNQQVGQDNVTDRILSAPLPEGYEFSNEGKEQGIKWLFFKNKNSDKIQIAIIPTLGNVQVDTEDVDQIPMEINGHELVYLQKMGHRIMYFDARDEVVIDVHAFKLDETSFWRYVYQLLEYLG